ncbi:MAG: hypothetical protein AB1705_17005 [Verrucomicrobiota bacterium]
MNCLRASLRNIVTTAFAVWAFALSARADDSSIATHLRSLGAEVTPATGAVTKVTFRDSSKLGDAEFRQIGQLTKLKSLTLYGKCEGLNDQTLPHLAGLKELEELATDSVQLSDAGLKHLTAFTNLRSASFFHISLRLKGFTGAGFAHLKPLARLERLTVAGTPFNDEGMAAVAQLSQLKEFSTWHTYQTEAGNAQLTKLPNVRSLRLGQRLRRYDGGSNALSLTDESLATLATVKTLETLSLDEVRLTYAGLSRLKALPHLKKLVLARANVPPADVEKLRADLPKVTIDWKPLTDAERAALEKMLKP